MALTPVTRTYEGRPYLFFNGLNDGRYEEYIEEGIKYPNGLTGRFYPEVQNIYHTPGKGQVSYMLTSYKWALFYDNGEMVPGTENQQHPLFGSLVVRTAPPDQVAFETMFGPQVGKFRANGFARGAMGFNNHPIYNSNPERTDVALGAVIPMTPEQEAEAPTHDYNVVTP